MAAGLERMFRIWARVSTSEVEVYDGAYSPGGVVILLSHSSHFPSQYFCAWGMWKTSSCTKSVSFSELGKDGE